MLKSVLAGDVPPTASTVGEMKEKERRAATIEGELHAEESFMLETWSGQAKGMEMKMQKVMDIINSQTTKYSKNKKADTGQCH